MSLFSHPLEVFVTHIEGVGPLLRLWVQLERTQATFVERLILQVSEKFERGLGIPTRIDVGNLCCARYNDGVYYRARVTDISELPMGKIAVQFIDYGNSEDVLVRDIRVLEDQGLVPLATVAGQATDFFLAGILPVQGNWEENSLAFVRQIIHYEEVRCVIIGQVADKKLLKVFYHNEDLTDILIAKQVGVAIAISAQQHMIECYYGMTPPQQLPQLSHFNVPPPPRMLLNAPQSLPLPAISAVQISSPQQMTVPVPVETVKIFTSPKLEEHSEHMVYVSYVEDGPLSFAVQLQDAEETLSSIMDEINHLPPVSPSQPLMPGSVCLGRFTEDQSLCRAVVMAVLDDKCKLYYVDFGNAEILPYSEIYELPQRFINPKVMALRFALSGLKKIALTEELKYYFKELVTEKLLRLRVVPPEGPPLKQYGELYLNNTSIFQFLVQKAKETELGPSCYSEISLQNGTKETVKVLYVVNLSNFFVQIDVHSDALNSVMLAVDATCSGTAKSLELDQLKIGMPCCALYSDDGKWYRAKVLSISANIIEVLYVDYGNTARVPLSSLKYIERDLVNILKAQAISCSLKGFQDNVDDELGVKFEEMTLDKTLTMVVVDNLENNLLIELYDGSSGSYVGIGAHLLAHNSLPDTLGTQNGLQNTIETRISNVADVDEWQEETKDSSSVQETEMSYRSHQDRKPYQRSSRFHTPYRDAPPNLKGLSWRYGQGKPWFEDDRSHKDERGNGGNRPRQNKDNNNWRQDDGDKPNRGKWGNRDEGRNKSWQSDSSGFDGDSKKRSWNRNEDENGSSRGGGQWNSDDNGGRRKKWNDSEDGGFRKKWNNDDDGGSFRKKWNDDGGSFRKKWNDDGGFRKKGNEDDGGFRKKWNNGDDGGFRRKRNEEDGGGFRKKRFDIGDNGFRKKWDVGDDGGQKKRFGNKWSRNDDSSRGQKPFGDNNNSNWSTKYQMEETNAETWNASTTQGADDWDDNTTPVVAASFPEPTVKSGDSVVATVVYRTNPKEFCVQITSEIDKLTEVMDGIASIYGSGGGNPLSSTDLKPGTPCVARYLEDDTVYRAIIQSVADSTASVLFCDYGNKEDVPLTDIKEISAEYINLPMQGILCKLLAAKPQQNAWSDEEIANFTTLTESKNLQVQFVSKQAGLFEVILEDKETSLNVNEKFGATMQEIENALSMKDSKRVETYSSNISTTYPLAGLGQRYVNQSPTPETSEEVTITWFISPEQFYCQKLSSKFEVSEMMTLIQSAYCGRESVISPIEVGSPVIAKYQLDGVLYRAEVKDILNPTSFVVQFVDFGNLEMVARSSLWDIEMRFLSLPKQAIVCSLNGINSSGTEWARGDDGIDKLFEVEKFQCNFHKSVNVVQFVSLASAEGDIADLLVLKGFAVYSKTEEATPDETEPTPIDLLPGQILPAYVTYVEGISNFFVQLNTGLAEKIQAEISTYVQNSENMVPIGSDSVSVNNLCIASPDGKQWYRGKIINCTSTTGVFVKFIDFGDGDEIPLDKVLAIPLSLMQYADQALECCISGSSDITVAPEVEDQFKAYFEATEVVIKVHSVENHRLIVSLFNTDGKRPDLLKEIGVDEAEIESVRPLPVLTMSMSVWVSHVDVPTSLWVQRVSGADLLAQLLETLYTLYETEGKGEKLDASVGRLCAAKSANDGQWYRGRLTSVNTEEGTYTVQFVDYGNSEDLPESQVMELDSSVHTPYIQAIHVALPVQYEQNEEIVPQLMNLTSEKEFLAKFAYKKDEKWVIDLFEDGSSISKKLLELELVKELEDYPFPEEETPMETNSAAMHVKSSLMYSGYISHVESPFEIWIQKAEDSDAILTLQDDVQTIADSKAPLTSAPPIGTKCLATFSDAWYRAIVLESKDSSVVVRFIDYGNTNEIDIASEELKDLPSSLQDMKEYAEKFCLGKKNEIRFNPEACDRLNTLLVGLDVPVNIYVLEHGDVKGIDIEWTDGEKVLEILKEEGLAETLNIGTTGPEEVGCSVSVESNNIPGATDENVVFISHVNSPSSFWIQFQKNSAEIEGMEERLLEGMDFSDMDRDVEGALCAATFLDEMWYRAKILKRTDENYEVLFIDYGNIATTSEIKALPEDLLALVPLAKHCSLLPPPNLKWSEKAKQKLIEKAAGGSTSFTIAILNEGDPAIVSLYEDSNKIYEELAKDCDDGSKTDICENSNNIENEDCGNHDKIENCEDTNKVEQEYKDINKVDKIAKESENCNKIEEEREDSEKIDVVGEESNEVEQSVEDCKESVEVELFIVSSGMNGSQVIGSHKQNAIVCHVNSLSDFWIQFEESVALLNDISDQLADSDSFPIFEDYAVGTLCVARFPSDGNWYRAKIINNDKDETEVMYVDFGNTSIAKEFRTLPQNLVHVSPNAKRCSLAMPENITEWPETAKDVFTEIIGDVSKMFEIEIIKDFDPAVISMYDSGERIEEILLRNSETNASTSARDGGQEDNLEVSEQINSSEQEVLEGKLSEDIHETADTLHNETGGETENINAQNDRESANRKENFEDIQDTLDGENKEKSLNAENDKERAKKNIENLDDIKDPLDGKKEDNTTENINAQNGRESANKKESFEDTLDGENEEKSLNADGTENAIRSKNEENDEIESTVNEDISVETSGMHETEEKSSIEVQLNINDGKGITDDVELKREIEVSDEESELVKTDVMGALSNETCTDSVEMTDLTVKDDVEINTQKIEHTVKLVKELNIQATMPKYELASKLPLSPRKQISEKIVPASISCGLSEEDVPQSPSSPSIPHAEKIVPGCISASEVSESTEDKVPGPTSLLCELSKKNVTQSAPSTPLFTRSKKISKSFSAHELMKNVSSPSCPRLPFSERIVPGCISRGESMEEMKISSPKLPPWEKIVPGCVSRGSSIEDVPSQEDEK